jgi:hypothetical protein
MVQEHTLEVRVRRHVIESERPFAGVLDGIVHGVSRPDIKSLLADLEACTTYDQFRRLVRRAQGRSTLLRFWQLDLDVPLTLDPLEPRERRRLVRLIVGNPVTAAEMTRHVPDAGSYLPVTILLEELPGERTRIAYDSVASAIDPYANPDACDVARRLDAEVLTLLRGAAGVPASGSDRDRPSV